MNPFETTPMTRSDRIFNAKDTKMGEGRTRLKFRLARVALIVGGGLALAGCASPGGGGTDRPAAGAGGPRGAFYAEWYDSTAVVLPPPPPAEAR